MSGFIEVNELDEPRVIIGTRGSVGGYVTSNLKLLLRKKPSEWHRFNMLVFLGWRWEDGTD